MNRGTIASLEQQARAFGATGVHVLVDGHTLVNVGDTSRPVRVHSVRKSLISALYGVAYDQGVVDLGASLGQVGIDDTPALTAQEKSATIEDLLTARSGVYLPPPEARGPSWLPPRGAYAPGTQWVYNNWDFNVLGNIYERLTRKSLYIAFDHHFARPLGFTRLATVHAFFLRIPGRSTRR
jgi:CubicO group peptidase (beta-lactamase class C family)